MLKFPVPLKLPLIDNTFAVAQLLCAGAGGFTAASVTGPTAVPPPVALLTP